MFSFPLLESLIRACSEMVPEIWAEWLHSHTVQMVHLLSYFAFWRIPRSVVVTIRCSLRRKTVENCSRMPHISVVTAGIGDADLDESVWFNHLYLDLLHFFFSVVR